MHLVRIYRAVLVILEVLEAHRGMLKLIMIIEHGSSRDVARKSAASSMKRRWGSDGSLL